MADNSLLLDIIANVQTMLENTNRMQVTLRRMSDTLAKQEPVFLQMEAQIQDQIDCLEQLQPTPSSFSIPDSGYLPHLVQKFQGNDAQFTDDKDGNFTELGLLPEIGMSVAAPIQHNSIEILTASAPNVNPISVFPFNLIDYTSPIQVLPPKILVTGVGTRHYSIGGFVNFNSWHDANFDTALRWIKFVFDPGLIVINHNYFHHVIQPFDHICTLFESSLILGPIPVINTQIVHDSTSCVRVLWATRLLVIIPSMETYTSAQVVKRNHPLISGYATLMGGPNSYLGSEWSWLHSLQQDLFVGNVQVPPNSTCLAHVACPLFYTTGSSVECPLFYTAAHSVSKLGSSSISGLRTTGVMHTIVDIYAVLIHFIVGNQDLTLATDNTSRPKLPCHVNYRSSVSRLLGAQFLSPHFAWKPGWQNGSIIKQKVIVHYSSCSYAPKSSSIDWSNSPFGFQAISTLLTENGYKVLCGISTYFMTLKSVLSIPEFTWLAETQLGGGNYTTIVHWFQMGLSYAELEYIVRASAVDGGNFRMFNLAMILKPRAIMIEILLALDSATKGTKGSDRLGFWKISLQGAGTTLYIRFTFGFAILHSCSEGIRSLEIRTTSTLSLLITRKLVISDMFYDGNPKDKTGAIVCRVAQSFLCFGSFQLHAKSGNEDMEFVKTLVDYTIKHYFSYLESLTKSDSLSLPTWEENDAVGAFTSIKYVAWVVEIFERTATSTAKRKGGNFLHSVLNTDAVIHHLMTMSINVATEVSLVVDSFSALSNDAKKGSITCSATVSSSISSPIKKVNYYHVADCKFIRSVLDGYTVYIFVYGQTGFGLTLTRCFPTDEDDLSPSATIAQSAKVINQFPRSIDLIILGMLLTVCDNLRIIVVKVRVVKIMPKVTSKRVTHIGHIIATALLYMHVKGGVITGAFKILNFFQPSVIFIWINMLMGMGMHGHDNDVLRDVYGDIKWGLLNDFHQVIQLCTTTLVAPDLPTSFLSQILEFGAYKSSSTYSPFDPHIEPFAALYGHKPLELLEANC